VYQGIAAFKRSVRLKCASSVEAEIFGMAVHIDRREIISRVQALTLLMPGAESDKLSPENANDLARACRRSARCAPCRKRRTRPLRCQR
jgi:hypothetical protein